jgi:hypothetical protein
MDVVELAEPAPTWVRCGYFTAGPIEVSCYMNPVARCGLCGAYLCADHADEDPTLAHLPKKPPGIGL